VPGRMRPPRPPTRSRPTEAQDQQELQVVVGGVIARWDLGERAIADRSSRGYDGSPRNFSLPNRIHQLGRLHGEDEIAARS
jgi:hypothetical protein